MTGLGDRDGVETGPHSKLDSLELEAHQPQVESLNKGPTTRVVDISLPPQTLFPG